MNASNLSVRSAIAADVSTDRDTPFTGEVMPDVATSFVPGARSAIVQYPPLVGSEGSVTLERSLKVTVVAESDAIAAIHDMTNILAVIWMFLSSFSIP
jgi:hypothetical protein